MQKVVLTGATGYIGSNIAQVLLSKGYDVHIIIRSSSKLDLLVNIRDKLKIHIYDGDFSQLCSTFRNVKPDIVIHLASLYVAEHKAEDIENLINSNILFGSHVVEAAVRSDAAYFINTGTYWQNFNGEEYNPVNLYAATKQAFECILKYYCETSGLRCITVKLIDTYGPFDPRPKIMNLLKRAAANNEKLQMSPGNQDMGLVYIDDVVKGFLQAMSTVQGLGPKTKQSCIIAPNKLYKLRKVVEIFEEIYQVKLDIEWGSRGYRNREIMDIVLNEPNIIEGMDPVDLSDGIRMMRNIERSGASHGKL
jgi:nucleoside-diphosphate-sugar epimerase